MKKNLILLAVAYLVIGILACSSEPKDVTVFLESTFINEHKVFLNDTTLLKTNTEDAYVELLIPSGTNTITVDGVKETFKVSQSGGILNVAKEDFYLYPIKYSASESSNSAYAGFTINPPVLIDSMIIYDANFTKTQDDLLKVLHDPNKRRILTGKNRKIDKDVLYIKKRWDLGIIEDIPEQLQMESSVVVLEKIIQGKYFLLIAQLSDEYTVEKVQNAEIMELVSKLHD